MAARFFGQFLLERGVVKADALLKAVEYQNERNLKIGELAVKEGFLTVAQADKINLEQRRTDAKFGEIAKKLGLLDDARIEALFQRQKETRVYIGEAMVAVGALDKASLDRELAAHRAEEEKERVQISQSKSAIDWASGPVYQTAVQLTSKLLMRVADIMTKDGAPREVKDELSGAEVHVGIPFKGDWTGDYVLRMSQALATRVASRMLQEDAPENALVRDALKEFANVVCGQICAQLGGQGVSCDLEPPVEVPAGQAAKYAGRKIVVYPLESADGIVELALIPA